MMYSIINNCNRFKSFTLAEVLITLVIIGVIAVMTVPAVMNTIGEQERAAKVKKVFSTYGKAFTYARAFGADMEFQEVDKSQEAMNAWYDEFMKNRLSTLKVCYDTKGCWNNGNTYYFNGQIVESNRAGIGIGNQIITAKLADGTMVNMDMWSNQNSIKNQFGIDPKGSSVMVIYFDINGERLPNKLGKDVFVMIYSAQLGLVPAYTNKSKSDIDKNCSPQKTGVSCIHKYLKKL